MTEARPDAPPDEPAPAAAPPTGATRPALVDAIGGKRGLVDSGLPAVVFVTVNSGVAAFAPSETALRAALVAAVVTGLGIVGLRLLRRETLQQALSGFFGLAIAVYFAARTGEARDFFLPGILVNVAYALAFLVSVVVAQPLVGHVYNTLEGLPEGWRADRRLRRVFSVASLGWAALFGTKAVVQGTLYLMDRPGLLAAARLLMGWPLYVAGAAATVAWVRRGRRRAGVL